MQAFWHDSSKHSRFPYFSRKGRTTNHSFSVSTEKIKTDAAKVFPQYHGEVCNLSQGTSSVCLRSELFAANTF